MNKKISNQILQFMNGSKHCTSDIETFGISIGYSQRQVLGGIGYLRSQGLLSIICTLVNKSNGRNEHLFV